MGRIRDGHIGYVEATALMTILLGGKIFRFFPRQMAKIGQGAGWIIILVTTLLALGIFLILAALMKKFPQKSLVGINEKLMGRFVGTFFSLAIFAIFYFTAIIVLRTKMEIIKTTVLPLTPISVLTVLFAFSCIFAAYNGIESISRGLWLFAPFILASIGLIVLGVFPYFNYSNIFPILGPGIPNLIKESVPRASNYVELILLGVLFPYFRDTSKFKKAGVISITVAGTIKIIVFLGYLFTFGIPSAINSSTIPLYQIARFIYFGRFVQRVEALFIVIWVFVGLFEITLLLYGAALTLTESLKLPTFRPLLIPLGFMLVVFSLIPQNIIQVERLEFNYLRVYGGVIYLIPVILLFVAWLKRKRGKENEKQKT